MITDNLTNELFLAITLKKPRYATFLANFEKILSENNFQVSFLQSTKDIWARDYMPIQLNPDSFIQFKYDPDYLKFKSYRHLLSNQDDICSKLNLHINKSDLVVDGGNVVKGSTKVIMCDKVFHENPNVPEKTLIETLQTLLKVQQLIFVPWDKKFDYIGHADGMVRFIDDKNVLINAYDQANEKSDHPHRLRLALHNAGLKYHEIPYNPYSNAKNEDATGIYLNYLQMNDIVFVPTFGLPEDSEAIKRLEQFFPKVISVESTTIAKEGGVLNCISWNIFRS